MENGGILCKLQRPNHLQFYKHYHKKAANGYAGLDNNSQISIANIPDIPQSKITNLLSSLSTLTSGINLINNEIGHANGIASLDNNGKLISSQIPSLAIDTVTTVQTIPDRNNLNNVDMGDTALVINDTTSSNNGSYIYYWNW